MKRLALIDKDSKQVVNVIMAEPDEIDPYWLTAVSDTANIGDTYDGTEFIKPESNVTISLEEQRTMDMLLGFNYNGTYVSVTKEDCDGVSVVSQSFNRGIYSTTNIRFKNGAILPMTVGEFLKFELTFLAERARFFS